MSSVLRSSSLCCASSASMSRSSFSETERTCREPSSIRRRDDIVAGHERHLEGPVGLMALQRRAENPNPCQAGRSRQGDDLHQLSTPPSCGVSSHTLLGGGLGELPAQRLGGQHELAHQILQALDLFAVTFADVLDLRLQASQPGYGVSSTGAAASIWARDSPRDLCGRPTASAGASVAAAGQDELPVWSGRRRASARAGGHYRQCRGPPRHYSRLTAPPAGIPMSMNELPQMRQADTRGSVCVVIAIGGDGEHLHAVRRVRAAAHASRRSGRAGSAKSRRCQSRAGAVRARGRHPAERALPRKRWLDSASARRRPPRHQHRDGERAGGHGQRPRGVRRG